MLRNQWFADSGPVIGAGKDSGAERRRAWLVGVIAGRVKFGAVYGLNTADNNVFYTKVISVVIS